MSQEDIDFPNNRSGTDPSRHSIVPPDNIDQNLTVINKNRMFDKSCSICMADFSNGEDITLTDQTEFNDLFSLSKNMRLSGCIIIV